jgi:DNA-binding NarL/FixJ family response regulator
LTFAGEYADKTREAAIWARPEPRPQPWTLQGVHSSEDRLERTAVETRVESLDRRHDTADPNVRVIACVDVKSNALSNGHYVTSEVLRSLAVRRMEGCIRPADRVCMLGASRLAVCFGHGSHRIAPSELGSRLARAMGDHLTVGTATLDLRVTIGVSAGTVDVEPSDLIGAAIASTRSPQSRVTLARARPEAAASSTVTVIQVPEPQEFLRVTHNVGFTPSARRALRSRSTGPATQATPHRLLRRTSYRHVDTAERTPAALGSRVGRAPAAEDGRFVPHSRVAGLTILVVDPAVASSDTPRSAVQGVAAAARRLGVCPILSAADRPDTVVDDLSVSEADAVVLILHPDTARPLKGSEGGTPWEHPARLARALVDAGASVIALSVGSSAAGVAACVEQGAAGLLHIDALADELVTVAKVSALRASGPSRINSANPAGAQRGRRQLPAPFDALVHLTSTERKVLFHMMEGRAAGEIASELVVSLTTVRSHIRSILRKLNVNSQLAAVAIANGAYPRATALG